MSYSITSPVETSTAASDQSTAIDPVCGMSVEISDTAHRAEYSGEAVYFCSESCQQKYAVDPWLYATGRNKLVAQQSNADLRYGCPMDPEVEQTGPGICPKCGMSLEPLTPGQHETPNPELVDFTRRMTVGLLFTVPLFIISMGPMMGLPVSSVIPAQWSVWLELILATPVVLWVALPFLQRGIESIRSMNLNMWTLIALGVSAAYLYSVAATVMPGIFPAVFRHNGHVPVYFESAAVVVILVLLGQILELNARAKTGTAIRSLLNLAPKTARRVNPDNSEYDVPLAHILVDDTVRLRPGESVPVDGVVLSGSTAIDESMITGEPMPVKKDQGSAVTAGTVNINGSLLIQAKDVGENTVLARIVELVSSAQRSRPPIQNLVDQVARWFVPLVVLIALLAFTGWIVFGQSLAFAIIAAVSVLVIACPCALGLATPISITTAMGRGAQSGVLIRDAKSLEQMANVDVVLVDKTGTLTEGKPYVTDCLTAKGIDDNELLAFAAALEQQSQHPLARAIEEAAHSRGISLPSIKNFSSVSGKGVVADINDKAVLLGNAALMQHYEIDTGTFKQYAAGFQAQYKTVMYLATEGVAIGLIAVADKLKVDTARAVDRLKESNMEIVLATGDNDGAANYIARELGIDRVYANLLPEDKKNLIDELHKQGKQVAMIGDGVNDAPALATADVGIAMGDGADVAVESAGITLLTGDLNGVVKARRLAQATIKNIKQNLFFAFFYNAVGVPVAAGVLYPVTGMLLSPMFAAAAMSLSSVSVVGNALRLRRLDLTAQ